MPGPPRQPGARKRDPLYKVWQAMIGRCHNPRNKKYRHYGGRGIEVCRRWRESFPAFKADIGQRPSPRHSIDRKDNDGHYEPSNVRWATPAEQNRNSRRNHLLTFRGQTKPLTDWATGMGLSPGTLRARLVRGWSVEVALTHRLTKGVRPALL